MSNPDGKKNRRKKQGPSENSQFLPLDYTPLKTNERLENSHLSVGNTPSFMMNFYCHVSFREGNKTWLF